MSAVNSKIAGLPGARGAVNRERITDTNASVGKVG